MREPILSLTRKDFSVRWFSGTGAGGQHRNKHQNCCEITHVETGTKALGTAHRSRVSNQRDAFRALACRLGPWLAERVKDDAGRDSEGVRRPSEIIRNYHGVRNQVKDKASGLVMPYTVVVEQADLGPMIEARAEAKLIE
ncbi:MAG: peptide chain release factor-like protein [Geminicoccaceae bacterium]